MADGFNLFGFTIKRKTKERQEERLDLLAPKEYDGSIDVQITPDLVGAYRLWVDWHGEFETEKELIQSYRTAALITEVSHAIEEIVNEAIVVEENENILEIQLEDTEFSSAVKTKIGEEFEYLVNLLDFNKVGDQIFRQWYIDGRQYYHKVIDNKKPKEGIKELNWLDPCRTRKVREIQTKKEFIDGAEVEIIDRIDEYFVHNLAKFDQQKFISYEIVSKDQEIIKISPDSISYNTSGLYNYNNGQVLSFLHKALKPANQLSLLEDSAVVYRLVRAPERRVFYIDTGKMAQGRQIQYIQQIMAKVRNQLDYDTDTGTVKNERKRMSMLEDIWLPRMEGGRGTEVDTLQGGQNLGEIEDILYFRRKLYKALNVPISRMESEAQVSIGVANEVTREELKFTKFVDGVLRRFNYFFLDILKTQLLLKGILTEEDWDENVDNIILKYNTDSHFTELKNNEILQGRIELLAALEPFIGDTGFFSKTWIRKNVLHLSEEEVEQIKDDWKDEAADPNDNVDPVDTAAARGKANISFDQGDEEQEEEPVPEEDEEDEEEKQDGK